MTFLFLAGLGASIWKNGGQAFSPGSLSALNLAGANLSGFASHAQFENQCGRCHAPLQTSQFALCLDCHLTVGDQVARREGLHGRMEDVGRCAACHSEHQGSDFDPGLTALKYFHHDQVDFSLNQHQMDYAGSPINCTACHTAEGQFIPIAIDQCASCHASHAPNFILQHTQDYGPDCLVCHDGQDRMVDFDHNATVFPLLGQHMALGCADCHAAKSQQAAQGSAAPFQGLSSACAGCHAEPAAHQGVFDAQCDTCHTPEAWSPARWQGAAFDHSVDTSFSLARHRSDYSGQPLTCTGCHPTQLASIDTQVCSTCHSSGDDNRAEFMRSHVEQYGTTCLGCHDGADRMSTFDHSQVFPLDGAHQEIECALCHVDRTYQGTPAECVQCHAEPAIHTGYFGVSCQDCHTTQAWVPARLQLHDFPLDHGERGEIACTACHPNTYTAYTCYGCHDHQPGPIQEKHLEEKVEPDDLANCAGCHPDGRKGGGD